MGIVNLTPDSFYAASRIEEDHLIRKVDQMIAEGATILDLGGYSSRPGAADISISEEINRVIPALKQIRKKHPELLISLDSFRSEVIEAGLEYGIDFINDITGGQFDQKIGELAAIHQIPYIIMHMKGMPSNMQNQCEYDHLIMDINTYFSQQIKQLQAQGVKDIILDVGFGFSKNLDQNFQLLQQLDLIQVHNFPILTGISRKSMIYKHLNISPEQALNGTTALNYHALIQGSKILRVHDVKEAVETVELYWKTITS